MLHALSDDQVDLLKTLFPQLRPLRLDQVEETGDGVRILARTTGSWAKCPGCGTSTERVHDRYRRRLHDLACGGRPVLVELEVRRFRCGQVRCPVVTFAEQVDRLTESRQRRTRGLRAVLERIALALAGRAGARMAATLGAAVSRFTLLRLVRALPDPPVGIVTVLGVDDFAKHKGHSYGTVLLDMDTHRTVDLLPDREADTFAAWLRAHPGAAVICRDRAGAYAAGARDGAPQALQVADRFHLWQGLGEAVEKTVIAHRAALRDPDPAPEPQSPPTAEAQAKQLPSSTAEPAPVEPDGFRDVFGRERRLVARHRERYAVVHTLLDEGLSLSEISRRLGLGRSTVRRFARAGGIDQVLVKATTRPSILDPFKPYLNQRWNDGYTNASVLHTELQARGWSGDVQAVRRYLRQFRGPTRSPTRPDPRCARPAPKNPPPPKPRRVVRWIMTHPDHLTDQDAEQLARILARSPELAALTQHVRDFATMMSERQGHRLDEWISAVRADHLPALHSLAKGLDSDHDAVVAGLTLPHSSGAVEGRICKIKFLKRLMFGRANFDLLRAMALHN